MAKKTDWIAADCSRVNRQAVLYMYTTHVAHLIDNRDLSRQTPPRRLNPFKCIAKKPCDIRSRANAPTDTRDETSGPCEKMYTRLCLCVIYCCCLRLYIVLYLIFYYNRISLFIFSSFVTVIFVSFFLTELSASRYLWKTFGSNRHVLI